MSTERFCWFLLGSCRYCLCGSETLSLKGKGVSPNGGSNEKMLMSCIMGKVRSSVLGAEIRVSAASILTVHFAKSFSFKSLNFPVDQS